MKSIFHLKSDNVGIYGGISSLLVFALISLLRLATIHSLPLPLWVDSVHHSAIARLILEQGALPASYRPYADVDAVFYHVGYHIMVAVLAKLTGASVEQVMLVFGQVLNALVCASVYLLSARWTRRAVAGLAAMVVVGTLSLMPAYYVTWGRYTQLTGLVILPLAMLAFQDALDRGTKQWIVLAGGLAGALFWIHYRVTFFFAAFALALLLWRTASARLNRQPIAAVWQRAVAVGAVALLLSLPWLWRLLTTMVFPLDTFLSRVVGSAEYNAVPWDLVTNDKNPWLFAVAGVGVLLAFWQRRAQVFIILLWVALTIVAINPSSLGLNPTWIVNNFSLVITLFVPLSLLVAFAVSGTLDIVEHRVAPARLARIAGLVSLALVLLALVTAPERVNVVNPVTILATADDVTALNWIRESTPPDAIFLVNERHWQGNTYVGSDGGYWIPNLTGRRTTMPIVFYTQGTHESVAQVNTLARAIEAEPDLNDAAFMDMLRLRGVTHVYIGARGGPLSLPQLLASPHYHEIYSNGAAYVFEVRY